MASPGSQSAGRNPNTNPGSNRNAGKGTAGGGDRPTITRGQQPAPPANANISPGLTHTKQSPYGGEVRYENGQMTVGPTSREVAQQRDVIGAWKEYNNRGLGHKILDTIAGPLYNENMPNLDDPRTYWGGQYHTSTDPLGTAAMIAGTALGLPGLGTVTQGAEEAFGFHPDIYHNGPAANYGSEQYGMPAPPAANWGAQNMAGAFSNTGGGAVAQQPGGASFGAQPTTMASAQPTPAAQGMFTPQLPNHTLPKDYASMFPNSLSEQDKALLYAKALGGMG